MKKALFIILCFCLFVCSCNRDAFEVSLVEDNKITFEINDNSSESLLIKNDIIEISSIDASNVAKLFKNGKNLTKSSSLIESSVSTLKNRDGIPLLYIVNFQNNSGFVIVSATKKYKPILAYADTGSFDLSNLPNGVSDWVNTLKESISSQMLISVDSLSNFKRMWIEYEKINKNSLVTKGEIPQVMILVRDKLEEWNGQGYECYRLKDCMNGDIIPQEYYDYYRTVAFNSANKNYDIDEFSYILVKRSCSVKRNGPLLLTNWEQQNHFNDKCIPKGSLAPAGCVAIALAQIMKYHQWPDIYDWNNMPGSYATNETQKLIKDIGLAVEMEYSEEGSSSDINKALNALHNNFNYTGTIKDHNYEDVIKELILNHPVYMKGRSDQFLLWALYGHAWVCDGFIKEIHRTEYYLEILSPNEPLTYVSGSLSGPYLEGYTTAVFHMNWGYGGTYNAWYSDIDIELPNGKDYKFERKNIINLAPSL